MCVCVFVSLKNVNERWMSSFDVFNSYRFILKAFLFWMNSSHSHTQTKVKQTGRPSFSFLNHLAHTPHIPSSAILLKLRRFLSVVLCNIYLSLPVTWWHSINSRNWSTVEALQWNWLPIRQTSCECVYSEQHGHTRRDAFSVEMKLTRQYASLCHKSISIH